VDWNLWNYKPDKSFLLFFSDILSQPWKVTNIDVMLICSYFEKVLAGIPTEILWEWKTICSFANWTKDTMSFWVLILTFIFFWLFSQALSYNFLLLFSCLSKRQMNSRKFAQFCCFWVHTLYWPLWTF
jgi:hypothetical protein